MISFWIVCVLFLIIALVIVLPPLLAKEATADIDRQEINQIVFEKKLIELESDLNHDLIDKEQFELAKTDLQRTLLDDLNEQKRSIKSKNNIILPTIILLAIPTIAVLMYFKINTGLESLSPEFKAQSQAQQAGQMQSVEQAIANLEEKLNQDPNNLDGWLMLGRSYLISEHFEAAVKAFAKANELTNNSDPSVLIAYGEAQGFANGQKFDEQSLLLFKKALQIDPQNERGLWYAGYASYQLEDYKNSVVYWEKLLTQVPDEEADAKSALQAYLNDAKQKAGLEITEIPLNNDKAESESSDSAMLTVNVALSEELQNEITKDDTLFVYARAQKGPKMPLALVKLTAGDLPVSVTLNDSVAMMPTQTLSSQNEVEVIARISKSGQAIMQSGDIYGSIQSVSTKQLQTVDILIDKKAQ